MKTGLKKIRIITINGPNLNLLGRREPEIYGSITLSDIETSMKNYIDTENEKQRTDLEISFFQSNSESSIIEYIHKNCFEADFLIINPGAFTHTSVAIRDAISGTGIETIEVHLSNIYKMKLLQSR